MPRSRCCNLHARDLDGSARLFRANIIQPGTNDLVPGFDVDTDWAYRSKVNFFLYESIEFTCKPLTVGGLRLGYTWGNGQYEAVLFARNITHQIRVTGGIDFNNLTGFINEPRMVGAQFKATF